MRLVIPCSLAGLRLGIRDPFQLEGVFFVSCFGTYQIKGLPVEITLSRKTVAIVSVVSILLILGGGGYYIWTRGVLQHWLDANLTASQPPSDEPTLIAVSTIYSPNQFAGDRAWETQVCANMTVEGCQLFKSAYAPSIWNAVRSGRISVPVSIIFVGIAEKLPDGEQVWKLSTSDSANPWIYVQVTKDPVSQKWLLARLLFSQEAQLRYGN